MKDFTDTTKTTRLGGGNRATENRLFTQFKQGDLPPQKAAAAEKSRCK